MKGVEMEWGVWRWSGGLWRRWSGVWGCGYPYYQSNGHHDESSSRHSSVGDGRDRTGRTGRDGQNGTDGTERTGRDGRDWTGRDDDLIVVAQY